MARQRRSVEGSTLQGEALKELPVKAISHNPRNPRDHYDDVAELAASIKSVGVLTPIAVTRYEMFLTHFPDHEHEVAGYDWVVLNGNRRLAALRSLDIPRVPATVVDHLGRDGMLDEAVLADNIHNEKLPLLREALALSQLVSKHGSQSAVAERLGKSIPYVNQRLGLLRLVDELQDALRREALSFKDARRLSSLPHDQQLEQWHALQAEKTGKTETENVPGAAGTAPRPAAEPDKQRTGEAGSRRPRSIRLSTPDEIATSLRELLSQEELASLIQLLATPAK